MAALSTIATIGIGAAGVAVAAKSGSDAKKAANQAAAVQQQGVDQGIAFQREQRDIATRTLAPWAAQGWQANRAMSQALGLGPVGRPQSAAMPGSVGGPNDLSYQQPAPMSWGGATDELYPGMASQAASQVGDWWMGAANEDPGASWLSVNEPQGPDYRAYVENNPDLLAYWEQNRGAGFADGSIEEFGQVHYMRNGAAEGRALPLTQPTAPAPPPVQTAQPVAQTAPAAPVGDPRTNPAAQGFEGSAFGTMVKDAQATFEDSPWWAFAQEESGRAIDDLDAKYGASGTMLSGQAVRARAEIAARLKSGAFDRHLGERQGGFTDYIQTLAGQQGLGFQATSGIASAGQNFANNASNLALTGAEGRAASIQAGAQATQQAWNDGLGFAGWGLGQIMNRPGQTTPTATTTRPVIATGVKPTPVKVATYNKPGATIFKPFSGK